MKTRIIALIAASASIVALAAPAAAQSAAPSAMSETDAPDDIIVTAQRRAESIQDVPIAMAAFTAEELRTRNVVDLRDVADQLSGVQIFRTTTGQPTWIIRGVGLVETNPNNPPPASVYLDEVYQVTNAQGQLPLFDVARIEVLKGPQGGTYGRNTTGGVVKIVSREPSLSALEVNATIGYGSYDLMTFEGGASLPIVEDVAALRIAGSVRAGGGWQYSLSDRRDWGDADAVAVRGTLLVAPTGAFRAKLIVDHARDRSEFALLRASGARATAAEGGTSAALWCPSFNAGAFSDACRTYPGVLNALGFAFLPAASPSVQAGDARTTLSNAINRFDVETTGGTLDLQLELGGATLNSITAYRDFTYGRTLDADATGAELGTTIVRDAFKIFSQELRLQSEGSGPFTWAVGASYSEERLRNARRFLFRDDPFSFAGFAAYGVANRSQAVADIRYRQTSRTYSGYVEAGYELTQTLSLTGAIRYTDLEKSYREGGFNFPLGTGPIATNPLVQSLVTFSLSDTYALRNNVTGNAYLSWKPDRDTLVYASVGRGIKEGGFFGGFPGQGQSSIVPFGEETVWAYEAGFKLQFLDRRLGLNGAAFYYDYRNAQASVPVVSATGAVFGRPGNVDARHKGVELEVLAVPVRALRLNGSVTYLDARYEDDQLYATQDTNGLASYRGLRREFAPEWSWNAAAAYTAELFRGALTLSVDANGRSNRFEPRPATANRLPGQPPPTTRRELARGLVGYTLLNGRIQYQLPDGHTSVAVFGRNLTDERYVIVNQTDGIAPNFGDFYNDPRTFGVELGFRF